MSDYIKEKNKQTQPKPPIRKPRLKYSNNSSTDSLTDPPQSLISQMSVPRGRLSLAMTQKMLNLIQTCPIIDGDGRMSVT